MCTFIKNLLRLLALIIACLLPLPSYAVELALPIACTPGRDCFIQNYVDHDASGDYQDYTCGRLSYNNHTGTDFRLPDSAAMRAGVDVLAAADGMVLAFRDGEADNGMRGKDDPAIQQKECGNGVLIQHKEGFVSQYCHMKQGSIAVRKGDIVQAGQRLGQVGLSGMTEFPHVHFEVRRGKEIIDPFTGDAATSACAGEQRPLWNAAARTQLAYQPTGILGVGFASAIPTEKEADDGAYASTRLAADAPVLALWMRAFGILPGDKVSLRLLAPDGSEMAYHEETYSKSKAGVFGYAGKKRRDKEWTKGEYRGEVIIRREGQETPVLQQSVIGVVE